MPSKQSIQSTSRENYSAPISTDYEVPSADFSGQQESAAMASQARTLAATPAAEEGEGVAFSAAMSRPDSSSAAEVGEEEDVVSATRLGPFGVVSGVEALDLWSDYVVLPDLENQLTQLNRIVRSVLPLRNGNACLGDLFGVFRLWRGFRFELVLLG